MKLRKTEAGHIEPTEFYALFAHCSDGDLTVTESRYFKVVEPLLKLHGVNQFEFLWLEE